jgi:DNA-binding beta-propeller fold protein YncE
MIRHTVSCLFVSLALLVRPPALFGKAETARVTVSGGGLANPIQITEAKVLELSQAWGAEFLDLSRPPLRQVPNVDSAYEVTFYSRIADNDIRKTCVFFYSPSSAPAAQGVIYLPGKGTLARLNSGTIIRGGRDGKWSYASPAWEALIKPFIAGAVAGRNLMAAFTSEIVVEHWTKPQPGWLYVLDPRSDPTSPGSRIWLVDPERPTILGSVRAGYDPDFALSRDGSHLYIASGERESGELAVMDTETGNIHHIPFPDRELYQPWYQGLPPFSGMAFTSDGRALWISGLHVFSPDRVEIRLSVFDTHSEKFLNTPVDIGNCGFSDFVGASATNRLEFLCGSFTNLNTPGPDLVRFLSLDASGKVSNTSLELPLSKGYGLAEAFPLSGGKTAIVSQRGLIHEIDLTTQKVTPTAATGSSTYVAHAEWPRSSDGARLYLGYGGVAPNGMSAARELRVFDTATWVQSGRVETSVPFWSAAASQDGKYIYAASPERHGIVVIDAESLGEKRVVPVGNTPSLAIVAPRSAP